MRLPWAVAAAVVISGLWSSPALAFHRHGCNGGTAGGTTFTGPTTFTTTRTTFTGAPTFFGSGVPTPNFVTGATLFTTPGVVTTNAAPTITYYTTPNVTLSGTTTGGASDAKMDQLIAAINQLNATLAQKQTAPPTDPGVPAPNVATIASVTGTHVSALERHQMHFDAHLRAGNILEAKHQWEKGVAYENKWKAANAEMEAKLKALKAIP